MLNVVMATKRVELCVEVFEPTTTCYSMNFILNVECT